MFRYFVDSKEFSRSEFIELLSKDLSKDKQFLEVFEFDNDSLTIEEYINMNILEYIDTLEFDNNGIDMEVNEVIYKVI
jgi:hypothetical protein